jgi:hypothetical protein
MCGDDMAPGRPGPAHTRPCWLKYDTAAKSARVTIVVLAAVLSGCRSGTVAPAAPVSTRDHPHAAAVSTESRGHAATVRTGDRSPAAGASMPAATLVGVPQPDYARPGSVAASFFTAWASIDTIHDGPDAYLARCADLVTPALRRQLAASQPALAGWQALRAEGMVSLVHVRAVTRPVGAPPRGAARIYLRVYAQRVTTTTAGRAVTSDGITLLLVRRGHRWLVSRLLWY